jgi:endonuclease/exonuclease/phosphatase family metal-dependent hydrolase
VAELGCDTVGLQEVDYRLDYIGRRLGMQVVPGITLVKHDGPFGNALLTRRKILDVRQLSLGYGRREPRSALDVDLDVCGEKVRVIVTHLGLFAAERRWQVRKLLEMVKNTEERLVVLGDINEWFPFSRPLRWFNRLLGRSVAERSFPSRWPLFALDRVWVRPRLALLALKAHRTSLAACASDHLPVKAIVATRTAAARGPAPSLKARQALAAHADSDYSPDPLEGMVDRQHAELDRVAEAPRA